MKRLPEWIGMLLRFIGFTNLLWGLILVFATEGLLRWAQIDVPVVLLPWYMIGAIAMLLGVAYYFTSFNPVKGLLVLLLGFLIKLTETVAIIAGWASEVITHQLVLYFAVKDLIWLGPLGATLYFVFREWQAPHDAQNINPEESLPETLAKFSTNQEHNLSSLSYEQPLLLVFLRHFGCTFCREALQEIAEKRTAIENQEVKIVLVHMGSVAQGEAYFAKNNLSGLSHISDPSCQLYNLFRLQRARFSQVFGLRVWLRGFKAGVLHSHGIGKLVGDGFRMPGVFLIYQGELLKSYKHQLASDRPDYVSLASCEVVIS
ncbi:SelL-related redox protein [Tunicatimonas pelagia]|uniref:SelL-related redox protein n=1 Tax=Tunicatimonas pelagia TaxID=931531 RepID=UPI002665E943|nr:SelL-related redox protein [Tunicatimonas pelagia]WKN46153.1 SelL-related redox protein [Tunicatimonas pelagia]